MTAANLHATHRTGTGKSVTRKIRAEGKIPGIVYGKGGDPLPIAIDPTELLKALDPTKKSNTVLNLKVDGGGGKTEELLVMLRDWQTDALRGDMSHADFVRVRLDAEVHATVPLEVVGKAEGVKAGGTLHQVFRSLEISCTPDKIPTKIEVNVEKLLMGQALHVRELPLPAGVRALIDGSQTICVVTAPKAEKVAVVEGAEAAVEGAAPAAEGAKAEAKPAAGAKPAPGAKPAAGAAEAKPGAKPAEKKK
jgi:large subunit ribosomal protein L25